MRATNMHKKSDISSAKRLLVIYNYCNYGGVTSVFKQRLRFLEEDKFEARFLFAMDLGGKAELENFPNATVEICPTQRFEDWASLEATSAIERNAVDCIILIDQPEILARISSALPADGEARPKLIYEVHTSLERALKRMLKVDYAKVDSILAPSKWLCNKVRDLLPRIEPERIKELPNFIDRELFQPSSDATDLSCEPMILWVGKLHPDKNYVDACRIIKILQREIKVRPFFITGGAADQAQVSEFLKTLGWYGITNADWVANFPNTKVPGLLARVRASGGFLLSTSKFESFGLAILEAQCCGVPVIAAGVGAVPEVIEEGIGGGLFEIGENELAARKLLAIRMDTETYKRYSFGALKSADRFDGNSICKRYVDILQLP